MQALNTDLWSPIGVVYAQRMERISAGRPRRLGKQGRAGCPSHRIVHPMGHNVPSRFLSDFVEGYTILPRKVRMLPAVGSRRRCPVIPLAKCIGASDAPAVSLGFFREQSAGPLPGAPSGRA
jgi:hypothetical protein